MVVSRDQQKKEAIERMKILNLLPEIVKEFEEKDTLYYSELMGILYWVSNKPEWVEFIAKFESKHNALVYHAELSHLEFGDCLSLLYVTSEVDEWMQDKAQLKEDGYCIAYVKNLDDDFCSEFGSILVKPAIGGIKRIG